MICCDVAIVGGGFSGAMVAVNLARCADSDLSVCVFESGELGRGAAYATSYPQHLLNTRAGAMSALSDDPDHFVRWLGPLGGANDFVSRQLYGRYVGALANHAFELPRFGVVRDRIVWLERAPGDAFALVTGSGTRFAARSVVLATGNAPPNPDVLPPRAIAHPGYVADPWRFDYRKVGGHVLLVGSGLTALDVLVALEAAGHRGAVQVVSRRGRFPEVHSERVAPYDVTPVLETSAAHSVLRSFRCRVREAEARGFDWRAVVDAIRPECEALWKRLAPDEQRRFDRHLRARWERHRHRAPQEVDAVRARYQASGRLTLYAGRIVAFRAGRASVVTADAASVDLQPDWIVNCTGPGRGRRLFEEPLLASMLASGIVMPEPLGLGIAVDPELRAIDARGEPVPGLWVAGPLARGSRFEATAVPELRAMAHSVAAGALRRSPPKFPPIRQALVGS